ncbi:DUF4123 domain-containing protein [Collimonas pratensis]|uniref:DUF4123 domain-containing protein n=1 Tax=Collimonas pratensis TaxID=279113 RepID=UPI00143CEC45|nr:DUF4123 domain-containing protein [Collimonas pratensis]NKI68179.1 DUF4123 domain-containing protein [Collimonas pratensis]
MIAMYFAYDSYTLDLADVLNKIMFDKMGSHPDMHCYALVDGAFAPDAVAALLGKAVNRQAASIYTDTPLQGFEELAPVLILMPRGEADRLEALSEWLELSNGKPMLSFVASTLDLAQIKQHFASFLQIRDESNMRYTLRFADTRMTSAILECLPSQEKQAWLGGMAAWWLIGRSGNVQQLGGTNAPVAAQPNAWHDMAVSDAQVIQLHDRSEADSVLSTLYETMPKAFAGHRPSTLYQQTSRALLHLDQQQIHDHQLRLRQVAALLNTPQFDQRTDIHHEN